MTAVRIIRNGDLSFASRTARQRVYRRLNRGEGCSYPSEGGNHKPRRTLNTVTRKATLTCGTPVGLAAAATPNRLRASAHRNVRRRLVSRTRARPRRRLVARDRQLPTRPGDSVKLALCRVCRRGRRAPRLSAHSRCERAAGGPLATRSFSRMSSWDRSREILGCVPRARVAPR